MRLAPVRALAIVAAFAGGGLVAGPSRAAAADDWTPAFFAAFEKGDADAALAAAPADLKARSPYDAKAEAKKPLDRDLEYYQPILERLESGKEASAADRGEAAVFHALGLLAWKKGEKDDVEKARRWWLLAMAKDPRSRVTHLRLARAYAVLEAEAMKGADAAGPGDVLSQKVGFGSADLHVELATKCTDDAVGKGAKAVNVEFPFDDGKVGEIKTSRGEPSGNLKSMVRDRATSDVSGRWSVVLLASDHRVLDESWFAPVETIHVDGVGPDGKFAGGRQENKSFGVLAELLESSPAARVVVFSPEGKRVAEAVVAK